VRIEAPLHASVLPSPEQESRAARLAQQLAASGGSWQWTGGAAGQSLTATLPAPRVPIATTEHESARA
jgi:hypothetical protein